MTAIAPDRIEDVAAAVRAHPRVVPHGARTKAPLIADDADAARLDMTALSGVTEYEPAEFTFTALAGTPLREIEALLSRNGQYLPFDPPLAGHGATIGGTLAAGMNGSCRLRYGGVRDFVIGVRFIDGSGRLVRGGGKVVKNAAGFDLPKAMVGSMGRLGVIVELSFKVFPAPRARRTLRVACRDIGDAVACVVALARAPLDVEAVDIEPASSGRRAGGSPALGPAGTGLPDAGPTAVDSPGAASPATVVVRVAGDEEAIDAHARRVGEATARAFETVDGQDEVGYWRARLAFDWVGPDRWLVKVPLTPRRVVALDRAAERLDVMRRYGVAGGVAWLAWPADRPLAELEAIGMPALIVRGPSLGGASPRLGPPATAALPFARRVKDALDPDGRLPALV